MTRMPAQTIDRWRNRAEPGPGEGAVYWHILMNDHPEVADLAREVQQRIARFPGLHMTPLERLHMTTLAAGPANQFSRDQLREIIKMAAGTLAATPAITVTVGGIVCYPDAIILEVKPTQALQAVRDAVQAATGSVTGGHNLGGISPRWLPHVTVCYSTAEQAMAPIMAAIGTRQRQCRIQVATVSLVIQYGPERLWDWRTVGAVHFPAPIQMQP